MKHFYAVIMAGGGGTRLWPASLKSSPKQLLKLFADRSSFQIAVDRLDGVFEPEDIFVVTVAEQVEQMRLQVPQIPAKNYLIEPMARGTAAVIAMAAATLQSKDPEAVLAILTADHFIVDEVRFRETLFAGAELAQQRYLVTLGVQPTYPSTGYGYIVNGGELGLYKGFKAYKVNRYVEKPPEEIAKALLTQHNTTWNSGMFFWRAEVILNEIRTYMPDLARHLDEIAPFLEKDHTAANFREIWASIEPETIDYGVMEKSLHTAVIPAGDLGWNDLGSWDSLFEVMEPDQDGNIILNARHMGLETRDSLIVSTDPLKLVVTLGLRNLIVVNTPDAILICPRGDSQRVKELVSQLKNKQFTFYL